jgi:hypothetical protein
MRSHNDSIDTTHTPPPLSFYNTFKSFSRHIQWYHSHADLIWPDGIFQDSAHLNLKKRFEGDNTQERAHQFYMAPGA